MNENENKLDINQNNSLNEQVEQTNDVTSGNDNIGGVDSDINSNRIAADSIEIIDDNNTASTHNSNFEDVEEDVKEYKAKRSAYKKAVALGLAGTILCGTSLGLALGVGINISKNIFIDSGKGFSFASDTDENAAINASPTGVSLTASEDSVTKVFDKVKNSVVNISITTQTSDFFFNQTYESTGSGSGIIYSQDNEKVFIVTNNHVVDGASNVKISITGSEQINARLVGKDASSDLAVISVLKTDLKSAGIDSVTPAIFGESDKMEVGEFVIAIGNALGQGKTTTRGIISAVNKEINIDGKNLTVLQTDAAINPGNSGGALVNTSGEVIGINTAKFSSSSVEGTGFAIPTSVAKDIIEELMQKGTVDKPYLGIEVYTIDEQFKRIYNIDYDGLFVSGIEQGSAAQQAGLQVSDIIVGINGTTIKTGEQLSQELSKYKSGDKVTLSIIRDGYMQMTVTAVLANQNEAF